MDLGPWTLDLQEWWPHVVVQVGPDSKVHQGPRSTKVQGDRGNKKGRAKSRGPFKEVFGKN